MQVHVTQHIDPPNDKLGTTNEIVVESIRTNEPKGYEMKALQKPKTDTEIKYEQLLKTVSTLREENDTLQKRVAELESKLAHYEGGSEETAASSVGILKQSLRDAQLIDSIVNG